MKIQTYRVTLNIEAFTADGERSHADSEFSVSEWHFAPGANVAGFISDFTEYGDNIYSTSDYGQNITDATACPCAECGEWCALDDMQSSFIGSLCESCADMHRDDPDIF